MPYAKASDAAANKAKHYAANSDDYKRRARAHMIRHRKILLGIIREAKGVPCADCHSAFPAVCMDFHHRDPATKNDAVANMISRGISVERLRAEIAKCDVICANCHRIRTHST